MAGRSPARVTSRKVFYIPGFDPKPPRRYRELYRREGERQANLSDYQISMLPRSADGFGWMVEGHIDDTRTRADIEVLVWSDIVRDSMGQSLPATYAQAVKTVWTYVASGAFRRLAWLRKGPIIAALYPFGVLLFQLMGAMLIAGLIGSVLAGAIGLIPRGFTAIGWEAVGGFWVWQVLASMLWWAAFLAGTTVLLRLFKSLDDKIFAHYLVHDYAFTASRKGGYPPVLEERMTEFRERIAEALTSDVDEVLVVGHSSGAQLAVSVLAGLLRADRVPANGPVLSLMTLGQVIPMMSFLPKADRLRADLHDLSTSDRLAWIDVSAPGDGCAFALCDPVAVTGVAPADQRWPIVLSAAFTKTLTPETWKAMRWRFFRLHFQYLCAFDNPGEYDYFQITAGPLTLAQRFGDRKSSMSRIDVPASAYTSRAA